MSGRKYNPRRVKIHRSYDVGEIAALLGIHKNTVRTWLMAGLPSTDNRRPTLVLGSELRAFLELKRTKNKKKCNPGELYCFRCRTPQKPAANMVDFELITSKVGTLVALCQKCDSVMHQRVNQAKLKLLPDEIEVTFRQARKRIVNREQPIVNSDFNKGI